MCVCAEFPPFLFPSPEMTTPHVLDREREREREREIWMQHALSQCVRANFVESNGTLLYIATARLLICCICLPEDTIGGGDSFIIGGMCVCVSWAFDLWSAIARMTKPEREREIVKKVGTPRTEKKTNTRSPDKTGKICGEKMSFGISRSVDKNPHLSWRRVPFSSLFFADGCVWREPTEHSLAARSVRSQLGTKKGRGGLESN